MSTVKRYHRLAALEAVCFEGRHPRWLELWVDTGELPEPHDEPARKRQRRLVRVAQALADFEGNDAT